MFTTNSNSFTKEHNDVMDALLFTYAEAHPEIIQADGEGGYGAVNLWGKAILEHLRNCDLIAEVD